MKKRRIGFVCGIFGMTILIGCGENEIPAVGRPTVTQSAEVVVTKEPDNTSTPESTKAPEVPEQNTDELQYSFAEETDEAGDGEVTYFSSVISYPVFAGGDGAEAVNGFVETLLAEFRLYLPEAEENAKYDYEEFKNGEFPGFIFPEVQEYTVSVLWQDADVVALYVQDYSHTGGAHPNTFGVTHMINKADGMTVESEAILAEYGLSVEEVAEYAAAQIRKKDGDVLYETDREETLTEWVTNFLKGNQWYLNERGLVIFANPYDIAPYAYGVIECEISYEDLEQGLKND